MCTGDTIYTIAQATGEWGCVKIGDRTAMGPILTQKAYNQIEATCHEYGMFDLDNLR